MFTTLILVALNLAAIGLASWFVYDTLKKEFASRLGQQQSHLNALQGRFKDWEAAQAKVAFQTGKDLNSFEKKLEELEENTVSATAIDSLNTEFFSLKTAVEALGQSLKKKRKAKKAGKRR